MIIKSLLIIVTSIGIIHLFGTSMGHAGEAQQQVERVLLRDLLRKLGELHNRRFTVEIGLFGGDHRQSLDNVQLDTGETLASELKDRNLIRSLDWLREKNPNLIYRFSKLNPKVINIIDARLLNEKNYVMEKKVDSFKFEGRLYDLANALGRKGFSVSSRGAMDTRELQTLGESNLVHINVKDGNVRDLLTSSLNLTDRGRVLWIAETEFGQNQTTYIRYLNKLL